MHNLRQSRCRVTQYAGTQSNFLTNAMQPKDTPPSNRRKPIPNWSASLSVGNAKLDEQHITLLELGRNLMHLLDNARTTDPQIHGALEDMVKLSRLHDALEESILEANSCPSLSEHRAAHRAAQNQLANVLSDASHGEVGRAALNGLIADWMSHHISENDLPVKVYLKHVPWPRAVD